MDVSRYHFTLAGESPGLIMHSTAGMIDSDVRVRELRSLTAKKSSKRTIGEIDRIAALETELSIYWRDGRPHLPAANVRAAIEKGARTLKDGPRVRRGLMVVGTTFSFPGMDASRADIIKAAMMVTPVKVGRSTVLRTRALFPEWTGRVTVDALDEMVDADAALHWLSIAGRLIGLGDWRPDCSGEYGRFTVALDG